jgi:hypothetical protein
MADLDRLIGDTSFAEPVLDQAWDSYDWGTEAG